MPHETALAKPLAFCDLQVGNPNPYQLSEGAHNEEEVRSSMASIRLRVASERIEPSLSSLKNTSQRVVSKIGVCWYPVWSLDFLGKYTIAVAPFA